MVITSLDQMEKIVSSRSDLSWDGWDVVRHTENSNGMHSVDGEFKNNKWTKKKVFPITENGWNVPNVIGMNHAQLEK